MTIPRTTTFHPNASSYGAGWTGVCGMVVGRSDTVAA